MHWKGESNSEILTDGLHSVMATPFIIDGYIYGIGSYGQLRCLRRRHRRAHLGNAGRNRGTRALGQRLPRAPRRPLLPSTTTRGDLIIARMTPEGYEEISRTHLIAPHLRTRQPPRAQDRQLVAPGLRQPAHLRPQRRRDHRRLAGSAVVAETTPSGEVTTDARAARTTLISETVLPILHQRRNLEHATRIAMKRRLLELSQMRAAAQRTRASIAESATAALLEAIASTRHVLAE